LKYKEYNKLRDVLSGKTAPQTPSKRATSRRPAHDANTPKAQRKSPNATPLKRKRDSGIGFEDAMSSPSENLSPQGPDVIGPTPQRDGIVLGLFDLLPAETPSKRRAVLADVTPNVLQTPSKNHSSVESEIFIGRGEKTPQSIGKRFLLDKFVTPQKRKRPEDGTPSSSFKGFATPAFLRRDTALDAILEDQEPTPRPAPWKRRGLGRSLSSMIQSLKKQEEDRLDEEAEIMREMELEAEGIVVPKKARTGDFVVEDSQNAMPLGPDRGESDEDEDEKEADDGSLDKNGNPRKVWKKRGQKRQTRRVISTFTAVSKSPSTNMCPVRPNFVKPLPTQDVLANENDSDQENIVAETQLGAHPLSDSDEDSEYASDDSHTPKKRKTTHKKSEPAVNKPEATEKTSGVGTVRTVARKIKATAHANYRRLKIKSKGGNGGKRFGRR
jgi:hypothetical protein